MKFSLVFVLAVLHLYGTAAHAQDVNSPPTNATPTNVNVVNAIVQVQRVSFGSGIPEAQGYEVALFVSNNLYHVPSYLPGYPTSQSIWPRVVDVPCNLDGALMKCGGYRWSPSMGRGEYIYIHPVVLADVTVAPSATH